MILQKQFEKEKHVKALECYGHYNTLYVEWLENKCRKLKKIMDIRLEIEADNDTKSIVLRKENKQLKKTLKYYTKIKLYKGVEVFNDVDLGKKAREVLKELK